MKKRIKTEISLEYRSDGFVAFTPADAEEIVQLDEDCQQVKRGALILDEMEAESYEATSGPGGSTVRLRFVAWSTFDGEQEALDAALENGWLAWPEEIENEGLRNEGAPLVLSDAVFSNVIFPLTDSSPE